MYMVAVFSSPKLTESLWVFTCFRILGLPTELITKGKLVTIKRFECRRVERYCPSSERILTNP